MRSPSRPPGRTKGKEGTGRDQGELGGLQRGNPPTKTRLIKKDDNGGKRGRNHKVRKLRFLYI